MFYPFLRHHLLLFWFFSHVSDKIIITWCSAQFSDKTHKSDNPYFRQMLYPLLRQKYFTHFSDSYTQFSDKDILPISPTIFASYSNHLCLFLRQLDFTHFSDISQTFLNYVWSKNHTHFSDKSVLLTSPTHIPISPTEVLDSFFNEISDLWANLGKSISLQILIEGLRVNCFQQYSIVRSLRISC